MYLSIEEINKYLPQVRGVIFVPFVVEHAMNIEDGGFSGYSSQRMIGVAELLNQQSMYGFAFTCMLNGKPVAVFGCSLLWRGVGEMWSVIGSEARKYPIAMTKIGIAFADICQIAMGLHRLQITVKVLDNRAISWARAIGFVSEGIMREYSEDKLDYSLMARKKL